MSRLKHVLFLLLLSSGLGHARGACPWLLANLNFSEALKGGTLDHFLQSKAFERLQRTQNENYKKIEDFVANAQGEASKNFVNGDFEAFLSTHKRDGRLVVLLGNFQMYARDSRDSPKRKFEHNERNSALGFALARFITSMASGIERHIQNDPNLRSVELQAQVVVNKRLARQLESFGFRSESTPRTVVAAVLNAGNGLPLLGNFVTQMLGSLVKNSPAPLDLPVAAAKTAVMGTAAHAKIKAIREGLGRDWTLRLDIPKPGNQ